MFIKDLKIYTKYNYACPIVIRLVVDEVMQQEQVDHKS